MIIKCGGIKNVLLGRSLVVVNLKINRNVIGGIIRSPDSPGRPSCSVLSLIVRGREGGGEGGEIFVRSHRQQISI